MSRGTIPRKQGEVWRLVEGTDDYWISNLGRFRHNKKLMKQSFDKDGYLTCNVGKRRVRVHRLVASAFIPNPNNLPVVDHLDGCKQNNHASNLRWTTVSCNTKSAYDMGLINKNIMLPVLVIDEDMNGTIYKNQSEVAKAIGSDSKYINQVVRGILKSIKGYRMFKLRSLVDKRDDADGVTLFSKDN